ncbi:hypothetical protein [Sporosarcina sp. FA9]|uniref:hypothetical protein n=1 Tax=Sporosarcina sp. FA9 TaxID=3413030 RepID=UPI003F65F61E
MNKRFLTMFLLVTIAILAVACSNDSDSTSKTEKTGVAKETEVVEVVSKVETSTEVEDFPTGVPLPKTFVLNLDANMGAVRSIALEIDESDLTALVARFNEEVLALGISEEILEEVTDEADNLYKATGTIRATSGEAVTITVYEYEPGGARIQGNTGAVSYLIN